MAISICSCLRRFILFILVFVTAIKFSWIGKISRVLFRIFRLLSAMHFSPILMCPLGMQWRFGSAFGFIGRFDVPQMILWLLDKRTHLRYARIAHSFCGDAIQMSVQTPDCRKKQKTFFFLTLPHISFFFPPFKVRLAISLRTCPTNNKVMPARTAQRITVEQTQIDCYLIRGADWKDLELSWSDANPLGLLSSVASQRRNTIQITAHNALSWRIYFYSDSSSALSLSLCLRSQCRSQ